MATTKPSEQTVNPASRLLPQIPKARDLVRNPLEALDVLSERRVFHREEKGQHRSLSGEYGLDFAIKLLARRLIEVLPRLFEQGIDFLVLVASRIGVAFAVEQDVQKPVWIRALRPSIRREVCLFSNQLGIPLALRDGFQLELDSDCGELFLHELVDLTESRYLRRGKSKLDSIRIARLFEQHPGFLRIVVMRPDGRIKPPQSRWGRTL